MWGGTRGGGTVSAYRVAVIAASAGWLMLVAVVLAAVFLRDEDPHLEVDRRSCPARRPSGPPCLRVVEGGVGVAGTASRPDPA